MGFGNFPWIFSINKLFVHSINLEHFKATLYIKGETENFGWQNSILMARELSSRYINIRELICLYWRDSSSQKHNFQIEHPDVLVYTHLLVETKWPVLAGKSVFGDQAWKFYTSKCSSKGSTSNYCGQKYSCFLLSFCF